MNNKYTTLKNIFIDIAQENDYINFGFIAKTSKVDFILW